MISVKAAFYTQKSPAGLPVCRHCCCRVMVVASKSVGFDVQDPILFRKSAPTVPVILDLNTHESNTRPYNSASDSCESDGSGISGSHADSSWTVEDGEATLAVPEGCPVGIPTRDN